MIVTEITYSGSLSMYRAKENYNFKNLLIFLIKYKLIASSLKTGFFIITTVVDLFVILEDL